MAGNTKIKPVIKDNLLALAGTSSGSPMFQTLYCRVKSKKTDILKNGQLSCAFFVTAVLKIFSLIKNIHPTVHRAERDMNSMGWQEIKKLKSGSVIIWQEKIGRDGKSHKHIGFYLGQNKAISMSSRKRTPIVHRWNNRKVEKIFWHPKLGK